MSVANEGNAVKMDDLVERLRVGIIWGQSVQDILIDWMKERKQAADRIEELEAKLAKAAVTLNVIDALDPEGMVNGCSQAALVGLVLRMGELARTTLAELSSVSCANLKGQHDE